MARQQDKFANIASAATPPITGGIQFVELLTGISLGQGMGIIIDQIDYMFDDTMYADMLTAGDWVRFGWVTANTLTVLAMENKGVIHMGQLVYIQDGTPATSVIHHDPKPFQFFPPIIVAAPRIYLAVQSGGVTAGTLRSRLYFRYVSLTSQEYLELAESFILVG